ncbi:ras-related protein Rab-44 isoform X2 [Sylvia atricapilla]|uniref:ras-related protein Rab-44 isoform X2 n=1 Tax=Sylvia atricapilla TaxID=48155 RepID=UPI003392165D
MEAQSSTNMELLAEVEADLQVWKEAGSPGTQQGGGVDPGVQLEKDKPEAGLGEEMGAAPVHSEGPSSAETPVGSTDLCGLFPVKSQALELVEADLQLCEGLSPETPQGGKGPRAVQIEEDEEEDGAQGQGEQGLPHEPVLHLQGAGVSQGEGAGEDRQAQEEAESLDTEEDQSSGANVELIAEGDELTLTPGESTETDLQPLGEAGSPGTEQGGSVDSEMDLLDQGDKEEFLQREAEDAQEDTMSHEGLMAGAPWGGEGERAVQLEEEEAQGQGEQGLPQEPVLHLQGSGDGNGAGTGEDMQAQEEAESLDTEEDESRGANVELIAEEDELRLTPGGSTERDLQPLGEAGSPGTEQGGSVDSEVHTLDQVHKAELVQGEAEDAQEDTQLSEGLTSRVPWEGEIGTNAQIEEKDDGVQGQGEHGLPQEPVLNLQGAGVSQGEGAGEDRQAQEEAESLDTEEDESRGANVELIAEGDELRLTPGESTEAILQPLGEAGSPGTEQGGSVDSEVQPLDQEDKEEFLQREAEDAQEDTQLSEGLTSRVPWEGEIGTNAQIEEKDDRAQGQGEQGLPQEPVLHLQGSGDGNGAGTGEDMQAQEEAESLDTEEDESRGANVELIAEEDELRLTPGGSTERDLQPLGEAGSPGTEQGGSVDSEVHLLDQEDKEEFLQREAEDAQQDTMSHGSLMAGAPWGGEGERAVQLEEEEAQGQGEQELPQEPVPHSSGVTLDRGEVSGAGLQPGEEAESLDTTEHQSSGANVELIAGGDELSSASAESTEADLQLLSQADSMGIGQGGSADSEMCPLDQNEEDEKDGVQVQGENGQPQESVFGPVRSRGPQGEEAGAGIRPQLDAESLDTLGAQSTDADVQQFTDQQKAKSGSGGSTEADLTPLGVAGMWEGQQSPTPGLEAVLGPSPTANPWEGAAAADLPTPAEAALCPEPVTAAQGSGLEAKLEAGIGPEGQILETQELLQGERAPAEGKPLDGAHSLEVAQEERLEAGARSGVKTQGLALNLGHDDAVLASLVSEVPLQISPLKLETMMQEDVLIPDVWRLCAPGQAAQRELQKQVSAQGHEGRPHTVTQQPERQTPPTVGAEHTAAGPAEGTMPPASTLHTTAQPEHAGSDQLGMVLRDNSLGRRQLLGEESKDFGVGQQKKIGQKMSQEGEPSPGEPGAVTAAGAGAALRGCPKAPLDPDHLYNVLFVGDSHVGKTSFLYRLHADTFNPHLAATVGLDYQIKNLVVDNKCFALRLWDSAGQERPAVPPFPLGFPTTPRQNLLRASW